MIDTSAETSALVRASQTRTLTDVERLRLAGLTFTTAANMEVGRLLRARHPDVFAAYRMSAGIEQYDANRAAAIAVPRIVEDPSPAMIAEVDRIASEFRATRQPPADLANVDGVGRTAFREALEVGDLLAMLAAWRTWIAGIARLRAWEHRRHSANGLLGIHGPLQRIVEPNLTAELESAFGGRTVADGRSILATASQSRGG